MHGVKSCATSVVKTVKTARDKLSKKEQIVGEGNERTRRGPDKAELACGWVKQLVFFHIHLNSRNLLSSDWGKRGPVSLRRNLAKLTSKAGPGLVDLPRPGQDGQLQANNHGILDSCSQTEKTGPTVVEPRRSQVRVAIYSVPTKSSFGDFDEAQTTKCGPEAPGQT